MHTRTRKRTKGANDLSILTMGNWPESEYMHSLTHTKWIVIAPMCPRQSEWKCKMMRKKFAFTLTIWFFFVYLCERKWMGKHFGDFEYLKNKTTFRKWEKIADIVAKMRNYHAISKFIRMINMNVQLDKSHGMIWCCGRSKAAGQHFVCLRCGFWREITLKLLTPFGQKGTSYLIRIII